MALQRTQWVRHSFEGGWATDAGASVDTVQAQDGYVSIPFLVDAENVEYVFPRGVRKIGGTTRVNAADIVSSTTTITGMYDFWRQGTAGNPLRRRVCHAGTSLLSDADDTVFSTTLATGLESGAIPHYATFDDFLIIGSSSTVDVPRSWDQTTFQNLAGSPPRFSFSAPHKNRHWAAGVYTAPSTLYYSANVDPEDWTGAGSGSIVIDPNDGDMITGIASYKNDLIVFKGPYKGSIHRITGSTPSDFARTAFIRGLGAAWQNSIVPFGDDLIWQWSTGTFHSLNATERYGDYSQAFLSQPIDRWIRDNLNKNRTKFTWGVNDSVNGRVVFGTSRNAIQYNDTMLVFDYRFQAPRWSYWTHSTAASLGYFVDGGGSDRRMYVGTTTGRIRRLNMPTYSVDGSTAYTANVTTPTFTYGSPIKMKTLGHVGMGIVPKGNYNATLAWVRDGGNQQSASVSMNGGDVLDDSFDLDESVLGETTYANRFAQPEEGGEFRAIQYQLQQGGSDQQMEVYEIYAEVTDGAISVEAV